MKKLYWLRNTRPCIVETPLKDCNGQPLKFTKPGSPFSRRCVTEEVRNHNLIELYINQELLADEADAPTKPAAAPTLENAVEPVVETVVIPEPEPEPEPEVSPEPEPEPAPEVSPEPEPTLASEPEPESEKVETESVDKEEEKNTAAPKRRRRRKS